MVYKLIWNCLRWYIGEDFCVIISGVTSGLANFVNFLFKELESYSQIM